eukprot:6731890-Alexandrium_andersonii.AAC.1
MPHPSAASSSASPGARCRPRGAQGARGRPGGNGGGSPPRARESAAGPVGVPTSVTRFGGMGESVTVGAVAG